jgi:hypothetical protein
MIAQNACKSLLSQWHLELLSMALVKNLIENSFNGGAK